MQVAFAAKNKSMEILSDVIFRGNINAKGSLSFTAPKSDKDYSTYINASEFSFAGGRLYYGKFGSQQCNMVVASPGIGVCGIVITGDIRVNSKTMKIVDDGNICGDNYYKFPNSATEFFRCVGKNRLIVSNQINSIIDEYDSVLLANQTLPANCTRFFFTGLKEVNCSSVRLSSSGCYPFTIPSIQVWRDPLSNPRIVQMEVEMTRTNCYYNFIGNIANHSDEIDASEFVLVLKK